MEKEFKSLSEKMLFVKNEHEMYSFEEHDGSCPNQIQVIPKKDVKEFIKLLKKKVKDDYGHEYYILKEIDKLAGSELI